ncbi:hypothetical protein AVEN_84729-1 [Araneus ventricosus]|uniref:Uncharacterized protein n=1 Tax=Araneus ventricosus TaxID=182803 RepID=A0A4Y2K042_ARAVE|nr:hypothetical protein AVEN_84729-1 [Araneus ventricosus]
MLRVTYYIEECEITGESWRGGQKPQTVVVGEKLKGMQLKCTLVLVNSYTGRALTCSFALCSMDFLEILSCCVNTLNLEWFGEKYGMRRKATNSLRHLSNTKAV